MRKQLRGTLAGVPQVLQLVWGASRPLTLLLALSTVLAGFIPAIQAYAAKLLVNAVVKAIFLHAQHLPDRVQLNVPILWGGIQLPVLSALG
ncbi:MAG: ABC transporter ATP-binding protein, partial [Chloroflexota bacterium]